MHLLTNARPIDMGRHGTLAPGSWVCHDQNAAELLLMGERGTSTITDQGSRILNGSGDSICFVRSGAVGDLLFLSPVLRALRRAAPDIKVSLSCFAKHHEVVCDLDVTLLPYPLPFERVKEFSQVISLENVMESNHTRHASDLFAEAVGVTLTDYKPAYHVNELERAGALAQFPKTKLKRVGIQPRASVANRDYPLPHWLKVIEKLIDSKCEVFLFGYKGQIPKLNTAGVVHNLAEKDYTFRQTAAILDSCDAFCGVDSSLLHLCHALGVPAVGLYAAFDWKTRTAKAPLTWALTGVGDCAPCSWHRHAGKSFPPDKPCARLGHCHVLADIAPERIATKILTLPCKSELTLT